jgi:uroporphyrinogen decarboxylase
MTPRERLIRTLNHEPVDRAPRDLWALPGVFMTQASEHAKMLERFPRDFANPKMTYGQGKRIRGTFGELGEYIDAWGSVWRAAEPGVAGEVKAPPLADWSRLASYTPPTEILDEADFSQVNESCGRTDHFVLAGADVRPFERLQYLRGTENLFMDLAYGVRELDQLTTMVHEFFCRELEMWVSTDVDGISFADDWGTQITLLIAPDMWRSVFKPLYRDYCDIIRGSGKKVFMHSDGQISSIYPDLIEIGVDALNSQLFCMDIEQLGADYRGKITFWGEIDRQHILPFGTPDDVRAAVRRVRSVLDNNTGGVIAQCEWGINVPAENIAAVFEEWEKVL